MALAPASAMFGAIVAARNHRFDARASGVAGSRIRRTALPAISVGNLTVGGTGKTTVAAWCVRQLRILGAQPAVVLRGYGDDEWRVHTLLNPGASVIVSPDRLNGALLAKTRGATCVVLDDAFQHRRASRVSDLVLVSADQWRGVAQLLPAGPFREPMRSLERATVAVITIKAAPADRVDALHKAISRAAPHVPIAVVRLVLGTLRLAVALPATGSSPTDKPRIDPLSGGSAEDLLRRSLTWMSGRAVLAVSAIGNPTAFERQLVTQGARVTPLRFRDHHRFTIADAIRIAEAGARMDAVVCTLKDAVKLGPVWPRVAPPLWYVSQSVMVERGAPALDRALRRVVEARVAIAPTAG
jgi:tetraacyldisaccharide 4'-kinase